MTDVSVYLNPRLHWGKEDILSLGVYVWEEITFLRLTEGSDRGCSATSDTGVSRDVPPEMASLMRLIEGDTYSPTFSLGQDPGGTIFKLDVRQESWGDRTFVCREGVLLPRPQ